MGTRDVIIDAAASVLRSKGLARATTKEIARAAGLSEAALYKHFDSKTTLFVAVLRERTSGDFTTLVAALPQHVGGDLRATLDAFCRSAIEFYLDTFPMAASLFAEPQLLASHREDLGDRGPYGPLRALVDHLTAEREHHPSIDPEPMARLLLGACFQYAFLARFHEESPTQEEIATTVRGLVAAVMPISPAPAGRS